MSQTAAGAAHWPLVVHETSVAASPPPPLDVEPLEDPVASPVPLEDPLDPLDPEDAPLEEDIVPSSPPPSPDPEELEPDAPPEDPPPSDPAVVLLLLLHPIPMAIAMPATAHVLEATIRPPPTPRKR